MIRQTVVKGSTLLSNTVAAQLFQLLPLSIKLLLLCHLQQRLPMLVRSTSTIPQRLGNYVSLRNYLFHYLTYREWGNYFLFLNTTSYFKILRLSFYDTTSLFKFLHSFKKFADHAGNATTMCSSNRKYFFKT